MKEIAQRKDQTFLTLIPYSYTKTSFSEMNSNSSHFPLSAYAPQTFHFSTPDESVEIRTSRANRTKAEIDPPTMIDSKRNLGGGGGE